MTASGELMIAAVVQLLDSTSGWPTVRHLHRVGDEGEDFEWREESEGRYVFEDILVAYEAAPKLLANERERRQADGQPCERLQVVALVLDGQVPVRRCVALTPSTERQRSEGREQRSEKILRNSPPMAGAGRGSNGINQRRPQDPRSVKRLASATQPAPATPALDGPDKWREAYANLERKWLA